MERPAVSPERVRRFRQINNYDYSFINENKLMNESLITSKIIVLLSVGGICILYYFIQKIYLLWY